jgi:hypothetical protein
VARALVSALRPPKCSLLATRYSLLFGTLAGAPSAALLGACAAAGALG